VGRLFNLVLLAVMLVGAVVTYEMKHEAEKSANRVSQLERDIAREKDAIQILRAELSLLLQPGRLQAAVDLYADHFKLETFAPTQYATIDEIPFKPLGSEAIGAIVDDAVGSEVTIQ
jgi:hypothetical protein